MTGKDIETGDDFPERDEAVRVAEAAVEKGQVAPGSIVGERARFWRAGAGRALRGELPGQIADLLRPVVIFKRQFKGQHGEEVTGSRSVIEDGDGFSASGISFGRVPACSSRGAGLPGKA